MTEDDTRSGRTFAPGATPQGWPALPLPAAMTLAVLVPCPGLLPIDRSFMRVEAVAGAAPLDEVRPNGQRDRPDAARKVGEEARMPRVAGVGVGHQDPCARRPVPGCFSFQSVQAPPWPFTSQTPICSSDQCRCSALLAALIWARRSSLTLPQSWKAVLGLGAVRHRQAGEQQRLGAPDPGTFWSSRRVSQPLSSAGSAAVARNTHHPPPDPPASIRSPEAGLRARPSRPPRPRPEDGRRTLPRPAPRSRRLSAPHRRMSASRLPSGTLRPVTGTALSSGRTHSRIFAENGVGSHAAPGH